MSIAYPCMTERGGSQVSITLPPPIAIYIAAENQGDTETLARCFAEHAVVRDEGRTIQGLAAIKEWKSGTRKKYQHRVEPLASVRKDDEIIVTTGSPGISPAVPSTCGSSS